MVAYRVINEGRRNRLKLLQRVNRQQAGVEIVESSSSFGLDAQTEMCVAEERNCRGGYVYGCQCTAARDEGGEGGHRVGFLAVSVAEIPVEDAPVWWFCRS
ncbi:hypothetical protein E3N88_12157 [Mikania micrantha]|uniref:Uncharacterized protein n=1 Tax=Mikania micrantha TaxID=192012 RepID=A0A5N6P613_9ASTR|nr:hypothetical protein E3N88_12157 [Mikania micrantha]